MEDIQTYSERTVGVFKEEHLSLPALAHFDPDPSSIAMDCWAAADEMTQEVLTCIHPTLDSDKKRKDVIEYVQRLIGGSLGCEVFPYGSVPLKTYLPDGDIDLTALISPNAEESLPHDILRVLQAEEQNENAEYQVKEPRFIDAEVKLVKCLVENTVVDISFNQLGGLCTLCFLEQVDLLVGKNHLFKRSIILIKAWCYYESRILGAHHGLISTYALETLILYIFHLFHSSLNCPIVVLNRFLHYFSRFDWESYCISLKGPVLKSSLPGLVVERTEDEGVDFMLSEEFLRNCMDMFSVPARDLEKTSRAFPPKHLNIVDPLKDYNNLGRSVSRGNFYRIRSACKYGARKLGQILLLPTERVSGEIKKFFSSILARHGRKFVADIGNPNLEFGFDGAHILSSSTQTEASSEDEMQLISSNSIVDNESLGGEDGTLIFDSCIERRGNQIVASDAVQSGISTNHGRVNFTVSAISSLDANISGVFSIDFNESHLSGFSGDREPLKNPLSDLKGDYDGHIRSLLYGQVCYGYSLSGALLPNHAASPSLFLNKKKPWTIVRRSVPPKQNLSGQLKTNSVVLRPSVYTASCKHKKSYPCRQRPLEGQGRNNAQGRLQRQSSSNGLASVLSETNSVKESGHDILHGCFPVGGLGCPSSQGDIITHVNGFSDSLSKLEFGSLGNLAEARSLRALGSSYSETCTPNPSSEMHGSEALLGKKQER